MGHELAIVGIFYDGYEDLWEDFLELLIRNWPDCPYPVYIVNETKELRFERSYPVTVLHAGEGAEFSRRVQTALEQVDAETFLLLLEDFFFEKHPQQERIELLLETMKAQGVEYIRMPMPEFMTGSYRRGYSKDPVTGLYRIQADNEYTVSCQPSLWSKKFLRRCIGHGNYNAWIFEGMYTYSETAHTREFLDRCRVDFENALQLRHGALQGKLIPDVCEDIRRQGYSFKSDREILGTWAYQKNQLKSRVKSALPKSAQSALKRLLGTQSVVDKYRDQILRQMQEENLT